MSEAWFQVTNDEGTGALDRAFATGQTAGVSDMLARFLPMNREFLEVAATRFAELIRNAGHPKGHGVDTDRRASSRRNRAPAERQVRARVDRSPNSLAQGSSGSGKRWMSS